MLVSCGKMIEPIEMSFRGPTFVGQGNLVLDGVPDTLAGRGTIKGPVVAYVEMSALHIVGRP